MKKKSCFTRTDLGGSSVLKRTESDSCWKRRHRSSEIHPFKGDEEPTDNCLNVYQQLTRSYSWLKQNVFHSPDTESIVISNKKIKHVLKEFNNKDFVVQRLAMDENSPRNDKEEVGGIRLEDDKKEKEDDSALLTGDESSGIRHDESAELKAGEAKNQLAGDKPSVPQEDQGSMKEQGAVVEENKSPEKVGEENKSPEKVGEENKSQGKVDQGNKNLGGKVGEENKNEGATSAEAKNQLPRDKPSVPQEGQGSMREQEAVVEENKSLVKVDQENKSREKVGEGNKSPEKVGEENKSQEKVDQGNKNLGGKVGEENKNEGASSAEKPEEKIFTLSEADQRAKNMAAFIEEMRASLAKYTEKEEMTQEDADEMLRKQEELMAKLTEFEEITKQVQDLAGIENVSSGLLGLPVQCRKIKPCGPSPLDNFPKVICFDRISQNEFGVPNMIVCEPVCKEKDPSAGANQPNSRRSPGNDQRIPTNRSKRDYDAERYIQNENLGDFHSTEVLGMLEPEMIVQSPVLETGMARQQMQHPGMMGTQPVIIQPGMMGVQPSMVGLQPGMMGVQPSMVGLQPGMISSQQGKIVPQPGMIGPQPGMFIPQPGTLSPQTGMMGPHLGMGGHPMIGHPLNMMSPQPAMMGPPPGIISLQPGMIGTQTGLLDPRLGQVGLQPAMMGSLPGMVSPQPGMMSPPPGMIGPQLTMRGPQEQSGMLGQKPQAVMMGAQGELKPLGPQAKPKMVVVKESSDENKIDPDNKEVQQDISEITIRQQELISVHTKIVNKNQVITDESETERVIESKIALSPADKLKTDTERPPNIGQTGAAGKDMIVTSLKEKIESLQTEMNNVKAENKDLQKRVLMTSPEATKKMLRGQTEPPVICRKTLGTTPICKLDLYRQLNLPLPSPLGSKFKEATGPQPQLQLPQQPLEKIGQVKCVNELADSKVACRRSVLKNLGISETKTATKNMETMVSSMEDEVRAMKEEISNMQEERRQLEIQKNLLNCTAPAIASQSGKGVPTIPFSVGSNQESKSSQITNKKTEPEVPYNVLPPLRDLREQYSKLQQDYQLKVEEVSMLRVELESAKRESMISIEKSEEAEERVDNLISRLKAVEDEKSKIYSNKDQMIELEQQLVLAKQRYREINEEIDELRSQLVDQTMQTDDYRKKFLNAQQCVEEQRRQIEMTELESSRFGEQVTIELQRVKAQFQTKLEEMTPLPELLKKTQEKLKETIHLKSLTEKNCLILSQNLEIVNEQKEKLREQLDEINRNKNESEAEKASLKINLTDGEKKMEETKAENNKLRNTVSQLEELVATNERKYEEKVQEGLQLQSQLETLREESARQVARTKDRYENMRKSLQNQIFELENQLASTRASAKSAHKDRDDIRQMMQAQIIQLKENFEQAQMRIRSLQSHVNYLKTSYSNIFAVSDKSENELILQ